ncbi:hypothetical protein Ga0074812_14936 [Parafrankia irregularis]|uniref:Uncharacterized protein n=1 Tax=Parafrankia irregularis TaxID=795642 RepID=A0A0S4R109_9ACTN|nr:MULTISPECIES: hypothetical protein [Parafrankia]MBE3204704.1 hypothetical protein [Parafrankia sp. CH37]CUU60892.1 hypothetical protein Ga0074812_14936 [Parafrankia irregularis]
MDLISGFVRIRPHARPGDPAPVADHVVPFLRGGCPEVFPGWPASEGVYDGPHSATVCPACLPQRRLTADIEEPYLYTHPHTRTHAPYEPLTYLVGSTPAHGVDLDLVTVLDEAGFTRAGWLPLPGLEDTYVWDHPVDHTRVILHATGLEFHLHHRHTGQRFHTRLGPRFGPMQLREVLAEGGYQTGEKDPDSTPGATGTGPHPALPAGGRLLTPTEAAHLITTGDHPGAAQGSLAFNAALIEALHTGRIVAACMPDGTLTFTHGHLG